MRISKRSWPVLEFKKRFESAERSRSLEDKGIEILEWPITDHYLFCDSAVSESEHVKCSPCNFVDAVLSHFPESRSVYAYFEKEFALNFEYYSRKDKFPHIRINLIKYNVKDISDAVNKGHDPAAILCKFDCVIYYCREHWTFHDIGSYVTNILGEPSQTYLNNEIIQDFKGDVQTYLACIRKLTFLFFAEAEFVEIKEHARGQSRRHSKIINNTDLDLIIVDSRWNAIVKMTDGFGVRGHWRLQPCGPRMKKRKLIWIEPFQKKGYTRKGGGVVLG